MKLHNLNIRFKHDFNNKTTQCTIIPDNNLDPNIHGVACCGGKDSFDRNIGRKLALLRAMQAADISRAYRFIEWEAYRCMTKQARWPATILNSRLLKKQEKNRKKQSARNETLSI